MPDHLGKRFLSTWIQDPVSDGIGSLSISFDDLREDAREAANWIWDYYKEYKKWPNRIQVQEVTGIELPEIKDEPVKFVADLVRKRSLGLNLERGMKGAIKKLEDRDPDSAVEIISDLARSYRLSLKTTGVVSHKESGLRRIREYTELKRSDGLLGFPTPWERLNRNIQGWVNGTLNVVTAHQNTGKTWLLLYFANHALDMGKKILFVTLEMDVRRIQRRLDALRHKISFKDMRACEMTDDVEDKWKARLKREADKTTKADILLADKKVVQYVDDVVNLVHDLNPDIVIVDGGYRFQGRGNKGQWEQSAKIVADLQLAAEMTDIPWVVTTQQGDSNETGKAKRGDKKMHAWGVRYAKEWVINPDNVIGLYADEDLRMLKTLSIHQLKMRDSVGESVYPDFLVRWDLSAMNFEELGEIVEEEKFDFDSDHKVEI